MTRIAQMLSQLMQKFKLTLLMVLAVAVVPAALAQRQLENLGRGVVAVRTGSTSVYVGWRLLGTDPDDTKFNLYRVTSGVTNLLTSNVTNTCNYSDSGVSSNLTHLYFVQPILNGVTQANSAIFTLVSNTPTRQYISIPLSPPPGGNSPPTPDGDSAGGPYTYNANDCSVGDVDGDGEYEIILKWDPSNAQDNSNSGFTGNTYLECFKLNGASLWRINLGPNIRSGAHYMDFMVFDFDGDGKAEVMCRTAPGSKDGLTNYVGGLAKWQTANGPHPTFNDTDDYRTTGPNGENGYVLAGPEFITVFNGLTGEEMATATYNPKRDPENNDDNPTAARIKTIWGDDYGNRIDRFLAGVAYLDGQRPSGVFCRGYYTGQDGTPGRTVIATWDWRNGFLSNRWTFTTQYSTNDTYRGQGAHSLSVGDVDGDGKDEVVYGACVIDDNGSGLYSTLLGHGDAEHFSDMDPLNPGLEVWFVHESPSSYGPNGLECHESQTGNLIFGYNGTSPDVGRGVAYDIDPRYRGYETWGAGGVLKSVTGVQITASRPGQMNFCAWWDADTLRESLDGTTIYKWDWTNNANNSIFSPGGLSSNNGTKSTPCLSADLFGDWREEVIWRTSDNLNLRIYTTTTTATNRFYTLMHDPQYRCAIAWQNTGYNQPPHPGFFLGNDMYAPPRAPVSDANLAWRGGNGGNVWDTANNWFTNGVWTNNVVASFASGNSVLFDMRASGNTTITLSSTITPGDIKVQSPSNFTFTGSGAITGSAKLFKAGSGKLTLANTNTFSGGTFVSGGQLIVNGSLPSSAVVVEARGEPSGRARIGGSGRLGQGLTLQRDCGLIVGTGTNSPGTLTVSNQVTELGGVLNQFDLSNDPPGTVKTNDVIQVYGNLTLSGTNTIEITQPDGSLGGGVYPLIKYTGTLTGGLTNFTLSGSFIQTVTLTNPPGQIALLAAVPGAPPNTPTNLTAIAVGAFQINLTWGDASSDENAFIIERSTNIASFAQIAVTLPNATSYQDIGLTANTTYYYRLVATNLAGASAYSNTNSATTTATPPSLTWKGDGSLNVWDIAITTNWLDGASLALYADGSLVTFDNTGSNSPSINLSTILQPGSFTASGTKNYTFTGPGWLAGAMTFTKSGTSVITVNNTNTYSGGTIISNGSVALSGSTYNTTFTPNTWTLGSGPVTFRGGMLRMFGYNQSDNTSSYGPLTNELVIAAGQTGTVGVPPRGSVGSKVTGSGTLALAMDYVRGDIGGDWTGFTGKINVVPTTGTPNSGSVDDFRVTTTSGFPSAKVVLATNIFMYSRASAGSVIPIGEFSSAAAVSNATVTAGFGSSAGTQFAVTWRVGGLNTDATNAALFQGTVSLIKEGSGKWTLSNTNTHTGTNYISAGTLLVNGNQSAAPGTVTVGASGTLGGVGTIGGNTTINGTLAPGINTIGKLTFSGNLTLNSSGTSAFEISRNPITNDVAKVNGSVTYGGTLDVVNISPELLAEGDSFKLFDAANYSGSFSTMDLPVLDEGLAWNTSALSSNGTISVIVSNSPAQNLVWKGDGSANAWDLGGSTNWLNGTNISAFTNADIVLFDDAGSNNVPVTLSGALQPAALTVNASKNYTFSGSGSIAGTNGLVKSGSGTLTLTGTNTYTGPTTVSNGTLLVNGNQSAATGAVTVATGAVLGGNGSIGGPATIQSGGTLSPGASIGAITFTNSLTLAGTTLMEISHTPLTNDVIVKTGALTFGGVLQVTNISGTLALGDSFKLFNASSYGGAFSSLDLPALSAGLHWNTGEMAGNGTIKIVSDVPRPVFQSIAVLADGNYRMTFSGTNGVAYEVRASTNISLAPITSWSLLGSGTFGTNAVTFDDLLATNYPRRFYLIRIP